MPRLLVLGFSISLDGYGAGPHQSMKEPLGVGGEELHDWLVHTRTFKGMQGSKEGDTGIDEEFAARAMAGLGAWIMGRNMFGPIRGPWPDDSWRGWWGKNPPYHTPVFVLTHHKRSPVEMEGGTVFHFVTEGIQAALERARETLKAFASLTPGESPGLLEDGATCGHTVPMGSLLTRFPVAA